MRRGGGSSDSSDPTHATPQTVSSLARALPASCTVMLLGADCKCLVAMRGEALSPMQERLSVARTPMQWLFRVQGLGLRGAGGTCPVAS